MQKTLSLLVYQRHNDDDEEMFIFTKQYKPPEAVSWTVQSADFFPTTSKGTD